MEKSDQNGGKSKEERVKALDLLRFLAVGCVMLYHFTFHSYQIGASSFSWPEIGRWLKYGYLGVPLFFVISGFVIVMTAEKRSAKQFAIARAARLYPAFWVACTLTFLCTQFLESRANRVPPSVYLINLTMMEKLFRTPEVDGVYWTLFEEWRFYLLIFVLLACRQMKNYERVLWGWTLLCTLIQIKGRSFIGIFSPLPAFEWAPFFIAGSIYYLAYRDGWNRSRTLLAILAIFLSLRETVALGAWSAYVLHVDFNPKVLIALVLLIHSVFVLVSFRMDLRTDLFLLPGSLTYALYLVHQRIGEMFLNHVSIQNRALELGAVFTVIFLLACLLHFTAERYGGKWLKQFLENALTKRRPAVPMEAKE